MTTQAQGTSVVNTNRLQSLIDAIPVTKTCQELTDLTGEIHESISSLRDAIMDQIEKVAPILSLLDPPTDIGSVISWITGIINNVIEPMTLPHANYIEQLSVLAGKVGEIESAVQDALEAIQVDFPSCSVSMPDIDFTPP